MTRQEIERVLKREPLHAELRRLVNEYRDEGGEFRERDEAWNLIADCVVENIDTIERALLSALQAEPAGGWKLVPVEPTDGIPAAPPAQSARDPRYPSGQAFAQTPPDVQSYNAPPAQSPATERIEALEEALLRIRDRCITPRFQNHEFEPHREEVEDWLEPIRREIDEALAGKG